MHTYGGEVQWWCGAGVVTETDQVIDSVQASGKSSDFFLHAKASITIVLKNNIEIQTSTQWVQTVAIGCSDRLSPAG